MLCFTSDQKYMGDGQLGGLHDPLWTVSGSWLGFLGRTVVAGGAEPQLGKLYFPGPVMLPIESLKIPKSSA